MAAGKERGDGRSETSEGVQAPSAPSAGPSLPPQTQVVAELPGEAVVAGRQDPGRPAAGLDIRIIPDEVELTLYPAQVGPGLQRLRPLWHRSSQKPGALVTITSGDSRPRVVQLVVRGRDDRWNAMWAKWVLIVRRPPESVGGEAAAAQDVLSEADTVLNLLVLPGEKRSATLEFHAMLDGQTYPGNYPFDVVATDVSDKSDASDPSDLQCDEAAGLLRLRHPAAKLLQYLPGIYQEAVIVEPAGLEGYVEPAFFERYLRGFEDTLEPVQQTLDNMHRYFGANTTPPDFLPWLASWVSLSLDENWPELKRRKLIREAVELYRLRGSRLGLSRYLEIYAGAGAKVEINDKPFAGMRLGPQTLLGRDTVLGDVPPHTFVVTVSVPPGASGLAVNEQTVRDIVEAEKPAHTGYRLRVVERAPGSETLEAQDAAMDSAGEVS